MDTDTPPPGEEKVFDHTLSLLLDTSPKVLTDLYNAEDSTREVYSDRFVFELLQNARDAAARSTSTAPKVRFQLTPDALLVANHGAPFTNEGYEAITGIGKSEKNRSENAAAVGVRLIGRKGIGFKSVLRVSRRPQIFSRWAPGHRFQVEFGSPRIRKLCMSAIDGAETALRSLLNPAEARVFEKRHGGGRLRDRSLVRNFGERGVSRDELLDHLPVMMLPTWVADTDVPPEVLALLDRGAGEDGGVPFDTVVRLPLDPSRVQEVGERLRRDADAHTPYSARTRCRARNGQTSNGDLPCQGGADDPGCALAGTDQDASARRADLSAQQARPSDAAQLGRSRRQAVVVLYSAKHGQRDQLAAPSWRCDQLRVRLRYRMQRL